MAAGQEMFVVQPWLYWAPRRTRVPGPKLGFRQAWHAPWVRLQNFDEDTAIVVDFNNPQVPVQTQDNGRIGTHPSGADSINLAVAALQTPNNVILRKALSLSEVIMAAITTVGAEQAKIHGWYFDPNVNHNFMVGIEGIARAGSLFDVDTKIYLFAYNVEHAEQGRGGRGGGGGGGGRGRRGGASPGQVAMNYKGEGAHVQVALALDAQPEPAIADCYAGIPAAEGSYASTLIDPYKRLNWYNIESIA